MIKKALFTACVCTCVGISQVFSQITPPSAAPEISSFNLQPDNIGAVQNSVNLFTGDANIPINLVSIPGKEGLGINVSITYNSNTQNQVDTWNLDAPTGVLGLGWGMDMPKIICDHKGTGTREDDTYYLVEGGGSNRLIRTGKVTDATGTYNTYQAKKYQFWQIRFYFDPADYLLSGSGPNKWVIVRENGFKYVYGDNASGRSTIQYTVRWNNWIGNSSNTIGQSQMATAWNLSEINNLWGEKATFEYTNVEQYIGSASGQKHTEASYLKQIVDGVGRKVQFFYNNKSSEFFMEPHTEQPEPDAYQENYEKQYLDHIDVLQETGVKYLSVNLRYTSINSGTNTAKMLLSYIEQRNSVNQALPGIHFDYYTSTGSTGYKGFLQKITYPTGGTTSYTYAMTNNSIGHSNRNIKITAPMADSNGLYGYGEPLMWFSTDYVVVSWRALGSGGTHLSGPVSVKLYVYQWVGEWVGQHLQDFDYVNAPISASDAGGTSINVSGYSNFQVAMEEKFFAVIYPPSNCNPCNYNAYLYYKDESKRANWYGYNVPSTTLNVNSPQLLTGDNFVYIASNNAINSKLFQFTGNGWNSITLPSAQNQNSVGFSSYCSGDNYFIVHLPNANLIGNPPELIWLNYLTEDKVWNFASTITANFSNGTTKKSVWHASESYAVVMADSNPEYIFRWDVNFVNPIRDNGLGTWDDNSWVFNLGNSMVGIYDVHGMASRFDGNSWTNSPSFNLGEYYELVAYGQDFILYDQAPDGGYQTSDYTVKDIVTYDPNLGIWSLSSSTETGGWHSSAGQNFYSNSGHNYIKLPSGTWASTTASSVAIAGGNYLLDYNGYVYFLKNGTFVKSTNRVGPPYSNASTFVYFQYPSGQLDFNGFFMNDNLVGPGTVANFGPDINMLYSDSVKLFRVINQDIMGQQMDYPVNSITISGINSVDQSVTFEYNFSTATIDPSGNIAQYADAKVIPGGTKTNGYTETKFNNGLDHVADPNISSQVDINLNWFGQPYNVNIYNGGNSIVSANTTSYAIFSQSIKNSANAQVDIGYYARPSIVANTTDGTSLAVTYTYDLNSGQVRSITTNNPADAQTVIKQEYTYWYEKYDLSKTLNTLLPIAQVSKSVNSVYTEAHVTRYKNWSALNFGASATVPAVFDQLIWNGTNSYQFSSWDASIASSTLADWTMTQQVTVRDNYSGAALETLAKGNIPSAVILDQYKIRPLAKMANANYNQAAYTSFEDNITGTWSLTVGNWTFNDGNSVSGAAKTGNSYFNLGSSGIVNNQLLTSENYVLSFWAMSSNSGTMTVNGTTVAPAVTSSWSYYELPITGVTSVSIKRATNNVYLDELRLYPKRAVMATTTYDLVYGPTSQADNNNRIVYTQYDSWGRPQNILDENLNIIKSYTYNTKK